VGQLLPGLLRRRTSTRRRLLERRSPTLATWHEAAATRHGRHGAGGQGTGAGRLRPRPRTEMIRPLALAVPTRGHPEHRKIRHPTIPIMGSNHCPSLTPAEVEWEPSGGLRAPTQGDNVAAICACLKDRQLNDQTCSQRSLAISCRLPPGTPARN